MKRGAFNIWWILLVGFFVVVGILLRVYGFPLFSGTVSPAGMVLIPPGDFIMGSNEEDREGKAMEIGSRKPWYQDEHPQRTATLPTYFIDQYEVTNTQYKKFIDAMKRRPPSTWQGATYPPGQDLYPVANVSWYEAQDFCNWAGKRLPAEAEWEKAARGTDGRTWPWGNEFSEKKANTGPAGIGGPRPVGSFSGDRSPYGVYDLAGNVREWTASWYQAYPGNSYSSQEFGEQFKVVRGDSWGEGGHYYLPHFSRASFRLNVPPEERYEFIGFRCAKDAK
jgi:formylglycine-generating enzyme required for sulfatase activity